jgi:Rap1a immunity proteins
LPKNALTSERSQVGMSKMYRAAVVAFAAALITSAAQADGPNTSAQGLLSAWKGEDANMRMVAEVIASAFASGLSWKGTLAGKEVYCPPQGFKGGQVMAALDQFLVSNPDMAEKSYGDAMAASLSRAFPCQPQ